MRRRWLLERRIVVLLVQRRPLTVSRGNYLTIWRKHPDGVWRAVYDAGSTTDAHVDAIRY